MTDSTRTSGKAAAAAAARTLLAERIKLVEDLGDALDQQHRKAEAAATAAAAEQAAVNAVRAAYTAAQDGGWSTSDLTAAGFPAPPKAPRRRSHTPVSDQSVRGDDRVSDAPAA